jgi:hypothetical protein
MNLKRRFEQGKVVVNHRKFMGYDKDGKAALLLISIPDIILKYGIGIGLLTLLSYSVYSTLV